MPGDIKFAMRLVALTAFFRNPIQLGVHCFEQPFGGRGMGEVITRITMQLLGDIQIGELSPSMRALRLGEFAMDYVGHYGRAQAFDSGHWIGLTSSPGPFLLERFQEVIE